MSATSGELDREVRRYVYDTVIARALPPLSHEVATGLGVSPSAVKVAFERLAAARVLVLQPETREILMAMPFSAVPTPFVVHVGKTSYYGNCIWDALGIPAMLAHDARVTTTCACCGLAMTLAVNAGHLQPDSGIVHFAVPPRRWWDNIVFT